MKWEYKVVSALTGASSTKAYTSQLNSLGEEGWEMCAETAAEYLVFKRPKVDNPTIKDTSKIHCVICGDPNCPEPNQKH